MLVVEWIAIFVSIGYTNDAVLFFLITNIFRNEFVTDCQKNCISSGVDQ